ncbi:MAG TPA: hypothetical protein VM492_15440 [Sumerlaeia bacterium]|nr:hypothetical protein [Sumerlaeia bacterium]
MKALRASLLLIVACLLVLGLGCARVHSATDFSGLKLSQGAENACHVTGHSWGIYCLWIPLITGNTEDPGGFFQLPVFLKDTVNPDATASMLSIKAKARGATHLLDVQSTYRSFWIMPTFVLFYRSTSMSGNGVK